ncbi:hypothetical protein B0H13DRAFT_1887382 [Mycena leptocephala]|nr:hypothetical protein B0H13DRAFT_1887382 [Mycena leptocephala]
MADAANDFCHTKKQKAGRHGDFRSASVGVSFGANTIAQEPQNLHQSSDANWQALLTLLSLPELLRIAGFLSFKLYAPAVFGLYKETVDVLFLSNPSYIRNFLANFSTFTATTYNFGSNTITFSTIDALNLAWGWCAILILSTLLRHSNVPIQPGESRYSFTQFTAAGIFRWVHNGFRTDKAWTAGASRAEKIQRAAANTTRRTEGFKMFSTWDDLFSA